MIKGTLIIHYLLIKNNYVCVSTVKTAPVDHPAAALAPVPPAAVAPGAAQTAPTPPVPAAAPLAPGAGVAAATGAGVQSRGESHENPGTEPSLPCPFLFGF